jgi:GTP-binding protein
MDGLPEIAFLGRSNVGKSSLINSLLQRKGLAKASNTPGRTQSINFFLINESFYFVDLPGYGYAKVSKATRADWGRIAEDYLLNRRELALSVQLIDSRHAPTGLDRELFDWLDFNGKNRIVAATKADKLSNNQLLKQLRDAKEVFSGTDVVACSVQTGKGREELWQHIEMAIKKKSKFWLIPAKE